MAQIGDGIKAILELDSDVTDIIGSGNDMNFAPSIDEQDISNTEYVTYDEISRAPEPTKDGTSKVDVIDFDITSHHKRFKDAVTCADEIRTTLDRIAGTYAGNEFDQINFSTRVQGFDEELKIYKVVDRYEIRLLLSGVASPPTSCPAATVENTDQSYQETVASGGTHVLPDLTHTDSDGSSVVQVAQSAFTCTLQPVTLLLDFDASAADVQTITIGANQAGTMNSETLTTNVASVTYKVNAGTVTFPFSVVATDSLEVTIVRTTGGSAAEMQINGTL